MVRVRLRSKIPAQFSVPSQAFPHRTAFSPPSPFTNQPDIAENAAYTQRAKPGTDRGNAFTVSTYDARPLSTRDFVKTFTRAEQTATAGATTAVFDYVVPQGRTAVFRQLEVSIFVNKLGAILVRDAATGAPNTQIRFSMLDNQIPYDQLNGIFIDDFVQTGAPVVPHRIPLYVIASERETVRMQFQIVNIADFTFAFIQPVLTGNLLLSEGIDPDDEPGTHWPLPVARAFNAKS